MWIGYLFTDIEGSTLRWEKAPERMDAAIAQHDELVENQVINHGGEILSRTGDGFFAVFRTSNPLVCARELQRALQAVDWTEVDGLWVRIGVHASKSDIADGQSAEGVIDRVAVNRAARIMALGWGGQTVLSSDAVDAFEGPAGTQLEDLGVHKLQGIDEPHRLFGLVDRGLKRFAFPPPRSSSIQDQSIPTAQGPLFGRDIDLMEIGELLTSGGRLVTITGPGGNGKTRLAAEIARRSSRARPVYFVELDGALSKAQVISKIAATLRFPFHASAPQEDQLVNYLRGRSALLILDNADAIASDPGLLDRIVSACPHLVILATSRGALGVAGEIIHRLPGLRLPHRADDNSRASPAFAFFLHEAKAANPSFQFDESALNILREICKAVSGSPLALQLIAPWTRVLSLDDILLRLQNGLSFLDTADGAQFNPRRTLRGVFDGSWSLLPSDLQSTLARMSVFVGDFDAEAASAVALVDIRMVALLEQRGLIVQSARRRFQLHPILREFSNEKLRELPQEATSASQRHADHYLEKIRSGVANLGVAAPGQALDQLQSHVANVRAAWAYAISSGANARLVEVIEPLFYFMVMRSLFHEASEVFKAPINDPDLDRYRESLLANCLAHLGELDAAEALARRVLAAPQNHHLAQAHAVQALGNLAHMRGDHLDARRLYNEALEIRRKSADLIGESYTITSLAALHLQQGDTAEARDKVKEVYRLNRRIGYMTGMMSATVLAGDIALREGRFEDARSNYTESLRLEETVYNPQYRTWALLRLGTAETQLGQPESAVGRFREALDLAADIGDRRMKTHALLDLGASLRASNDGHQAKSCLLDGLRVAMDIGAEPLAIRALLELGRVQVLLRNQEAARRIASRIAGLELGVQRDEYAAFLAELDAPPGLSQARELRHVVDDVLEDFELAELGL